METPKQIIEDIRRIRFGIGLDTTNLTDDLREILEDKKKFMKDASWLASALHSEKPHFILELIQNAEDNDYEEKIDPMIKFIIQDNKLILQNNEKGFTKENVWALCGIGESTKRNKKLLGYIGEKGIGFKSVFMVTKEPHIYSNGFHFKFEYDEKEPVSIIVPHWIDEIPSFVDSGKTNIVLPLNDESIKEVSKYIEEIDPCILLFLRKLNFIEIENKIINKTHRIERHDFDGKVKIVHSGGENYWKIVKSDTLKISSYIQKKIREGIEDTEIILAFPLKDDGSADCSTEQNVFAFLPVRQYGFKFVIQADFILPPSREDIYKDQSEQSWNKFLRDNIATVFLKAVEEFKLDENLKTTYYNFIPLVDDLKDDFFSPVVEEIHKKLKSSRCILTESNNWLEPEKVFRADEDIRKLIPNDDLKNFFGDKEYISKQIKVKKDILDAIGVPVFGFDELIQFLQKEEWLQEKTDDWFVDIYLYLNKKLLSDEQKNQIKGLKILRLENDELTSINDGPVFFPLEKKIEYGFEKELRIIKRSIFEPKDKNKRDASAEFLKKIGVQYPSPYEIIENHILPIYENGDWKNKKTQQLLGYVRYIKENLQNYEKESDKHLNSNNQFGRTKKDPLGRLKRSIYIRINKTIENVNDYDNPQNIYLPKIYGNENDLESLFEGIENVKFVHREYIDDIIKKYRQVKRKDKKNKADIRNKRETEIKEWREFFIKLGVNDGLKVKEISWYESYLTEQDKKQLRRGSICTYDTVYDYKLILLEQVLERIDEKKAKNLVRLLENQWLYLAKFLQLEYSWRYYGWHTKYADSTWLHLLKTTNWLPTSKGTFAKPFEVFLDKPEIKQLLGDSVPYLTIDIKNEYFIKTLKINSEANIEGVINYLKSLKDQNCQDKTLFSKLYEFLNKKYWDDEYTIKTAFLEHQIIYVPETSQSYYTSREVLWKNESKIFGDKLGYLEEHYPSLKSFFVDKLGVSEKPAPKDYANVLMDLSCKKNFNKDDEKLVIKIYQELNNYLNPDENEHLPSEEDWGDDFIQKPIFWTNKEEFWRNNNNVFVNDNEELYELFKNKSKVAFLKLPENYYPKLQYFIKATKLLYLSKAIEIEPKFNENQNVDNKLTNDIQKFIPFILRYLYQSAYGNFAKLKNDGKLNQLINLECYTVESLKVEYKLGEESVITERSSLLYDGKLYIQKDQVENTDILGIELSKLFGEITGLDDFIITLFEKKTDEKIEQYLKVKGIKELPEEEKKWFVKSSHEPEPPGGPEPESPGGPEPKPPGGPEPKPTRSSEPKPPSIPAETIEWEPQCKPKEVEPRIKEIDIPVTGSKDSGGGDSGEVPQKKGEGQKDQDEKKDEDEGKKNAISQKDKVKIGKWGEEYALMCLKEKLKKKYQNGKIEETSSGFNIVVDDMVVVEVDWLNAIGDSGEGYDIKVTEKNSEWYIEVKTTKTDKKDWFDISSKQWEIMEKEGDMFHIYRVYNAGTQKAYIVDIPNPYEMWREGNLTAYPIRIQI